MTKVLTAKDLISVICMSTFETLLSQQTSHFVSNRFCLFFAHNCCGTYIWQCLVGPREHFKPFFLLKRSMIPFRNRFLRNRIKAELQFGTFGSGVRFPSAVMMSSRNNGCLVSSGRFGTRLARHRFLFALRQSARKSKHAKILSLCFRVSRRDPVDGGVGVYGFGCSICF